MSGSDGEAADEDNSSGNEAGNEADISASADSATPVKKLAKPKKAPLNLTKSATMKKTADDPVKRKSTSTKNTNNDQDEAEVDVDTSGNIAKKRRSDGTLAPIPVPASYDAASEADKELLRMKDAGYTWTKIRARWEEITGQRVGASTLPNRYVRLKATIAQFTEEDDLCLKKCKQDIEGAFEREKWSMISDAMAKKGHPGFVAASLINRFNQMDSAKLPPQ